MPTYNSISSTKYLLCLIIFIISGCSDNVKTHAFINETPQSVIDVVHKNSELPSIQNFIGLDKTETPAVAHVTVWDRLFSLYALPEIDNDRVEHEVQRYLKHPEYLAKIQRRAAPYLHYIVEEIESKQIPGELALLPVVESAFIPKALSKSKASGLWQFMPATGRLFGLKQNWWYDGRRDVHTSTKAATSYLKQLSKSFDGDWFLALASYNAGKGNIRKAIRKNKKKNIATDYWSLPLRKETENYIPRLLAIAKIFANADKYNIPLQAIPNKPHFSVININSQIDLSIAAEMANTPLDEFFILNPAFKRGSTDPDGPFHLLIHAEKAEEFKIKLAKTLEKDRMRWTRHQIKTGENLGLIAKKHNTTVNALLKSNHLANTNIRAGRYLLIPSLITHTLANSTKDKRQLYTVKQGDTFWDIARQFDVRSKDIAAWNNISLNKMLQPGQKLIIKKS